MWLHLLSDTKWTKGIYRGYCFHTLTQPQSGLNFKSYIQCRHCCLLIARWRFSVAINTEAGMFR